MLNVRTARGISRHLLARLPPAASPRQGMEIASYNCLSFDRFRILPAPETPFQRHRRPVGLELRGRFLGWMLEMKSVRFPQAKSGCARIFHQPVTSDIQTTWEQPEPSADEPLPLHQATMHEPQGHLLSSGWEKLVQATPRTRRLSGVSGTIGRTPPSPIVVVLEQLPHNPDAMVLGAVRKQEQRTDPNDTP